MENSEDNVVSSEREESLASESYDTNDEIEFEELESDIANNDNIGEDAGPYSRELLADDKWLREYYREREIIEENERHLQDRLDRVVEIYTWYVVYILCHVATARSSARYFFPHRLTSSFSLAQPTKPFVWLDASQDSTTGSSGISDSV